MKCKKCGAIHKTRMEMILDILEWTNQKSRSKYGSTVLSSEEMYNLWVFLRENWSE